MPNQLYDEFGTPRYGHAECHVCGEDEIGSHGEVAWCHRCGWRGSVRDHFIGPIRDEVRSSQAA